MKIAGFEVGKKHAIVIGGIVGVITIATLISNHEKNKELAERQAEAEARLEAAEAQATEEPVTEELSDEELEKQQLIEKFGEPPEGFMWNDEGELYALSDDSKTAEEVLYTYIRSLSIQDFSTAQKYAKTSGTIKQYNNYFDESNTDSDYYLIFLRKEYKLAITSIEILSAEDTAVLADGTTVVSMRLNLLDLTNKDFWKDDAETIYNTLRGYRQTEEDTIKASQYLYDYIYDSYQSGKVPKHEVVCNIKLTKEYGSGWLVDDDYELVHNLLYEEGVNVYEDIMTNYQEWLDATLDKEQEEKERQAEIEQERADAELEKQQKASKK